MRPIAGASASIMIEDMINEKIQVRSNSVDFTVCEVLKLKTEGSLDFGGGEFEASNVDKVEPVKREEDDDYGWWTLSGGTYLVRYNESISQLEGCGLLSPHPNLMLSGCTHPTLLLKEWKKDYVVPLEVQKEGVRIKQNARISKLFVLE